MLPVLEAFALERVDFGGSSLPCIVSVKDENGNPLRDWYVIKIFSDHRRDHTCKEVYASILAQHFELNTPEPALVYVGNALLNQLKKHEKYKNWKVTEGVFFASKYLIDAKSFTDTVPLRKYEYWEIGNIFAFDVFIMNSDRQVGNPNLIVKNKNIYVIDHEYSMRVSKTFDDYLIKNHWDKTIKEDNGGHLFRQHLWQMSKKSKVTFDEFAENLRTLNLEKLYVHVEQLAEFEYGQLDIGNIVSYFADIKKNESKFLTLLDNLLH